MADNISVKDSGGVARTIRATDNGGVLTPHNIIDQAPGAPNVNLTQAATSTTAASLLAARPTRRQVQIKNSDASANIAIGATSGVTTGNGFLLKPGESVTLLTTAQIYAIASAGTPVASISESYD
jgi:hypothetical protein